MCIHVVVISYIFVVVCGSLMLACFCGHLDMVKYLRACGALWSSQDKAGCTALHWAADGAHLAVMQHMIEDNCEVRRLLIISSVQRCITLNS